MNRFPLPADRSPWNKVMVDLTVRCNLSCPVCYRAGSGRSDIPLKELASLASRWRGLIVSLCGGEPTLREDLPDIIRLFTRANTVFLITNGLRLADRSYVRLLRRHGLSFVSFSLNGTDDRAFRALNGSSLCGEKFRALENLKAERISAVVSMVLARGINEDQLAPVAEYCLANRDFIRELRIRAMAALGRRLDGDRFGLGELLSTVCRELQVDPAHVEAEQALKRRVNAFMKREVFVETPCSADFHVRRGNGGFSAAGSSIRSGRGLPGLARDLLGAYGPAMAAAGFAKSVLRYERLPWVHASSALKVGLRVWPDNPAPSGPEYAKCRTGYYLNGDILPFCCANARLDAGPGGGG